MIVNNIAANAAGLKTQILLPVFNGSGGGVIESVGNSIDGYRMNFYHAQAGGVLTFGTGGDIERMRILANGNIGIWNSSPNARLHINSPNAGSSTLIGFRVETQRASGDAEPHLRMVRIGVEGWSLAQPWVDLALYSDGNIANPQFTFSNAGNFKATGLVGFGMDAQAGRSLSLMAINTGDRSGVRVYDYGGFVSNGAQSGFEVAYLGGSFSSPTTTVAGHYRNILTFRTGGTGASLFANPSFAVRCTIGASLGSVLSEVNTSFLCNSTTSGTPYEIQTMYGQTGLVEFPIGAIRLSGDSGVRLKNNTGLLEIRNGLDNGNASVSCAGYYARAGGFYLRDGSSGSDHWRLYKDNGDNNAYFRDVVNTRNHVTFYPGVNSSSNGTHFHSRVLVDDAFIVSGGAGIVFSGATPVVYGSSAPWMMYSANSANTLYLRDVTNARMHVTYVHGASAATASTSIHSSLSVAGAATLSSSLSVAGNASFSAAILGYSALDLYNSTNYTRIMRTSDGRLTIYRPNDVSTAAVSFGGGNDEIHIRGGLGVIAHSGANLSIGPSASGGTLTLGSPSSNVFISAGGGDPLIQMTGRLTVSSNLQVSGAMIVASNPPANASAAGTAGTITYDSNYIYVCTAANTWKRAALATW